MTQPPQSGTETSEQVVFEGSYLRLIRRGTWEFTQRKGSRGVVGIVAVTEEGKMLLVEQFRIPVGCRVIELPAGLAGDVAGTGGEDLADAARRELLEETGYAAARMKHLATGPSSAGMTDECVVLFAAEGLIRVHGGGGDETEDIVVHEIPLDGLVPWLRAQASAGKLIDFKIWAALTLLRSS